MTPGTLTRKTRLAPGGRLRHCSRKRAANLRARRKVLPEVYARTEGECRGGSPWCTGHVEVGHEPLPRSGGGDESDPNDIGGICDGCHEFAHSHPIEAVRLGLKVSRYSGGGKYAVPDGAGQEVA